MAEQSGEDTLLLDLGKGTNEAFDRMLRDAAMQADEAMRAGSETGRFRALPHLLTLVKADKSVREAVAFLPHVPNVKTGKMEPRKASGAWSETYRTVVRLVKVAKVGPESMVARLQAGIQRTDPATAFETFTHLTRAVDAALKQLTEDGTIKARKAGGRRMTRDERAMSLVTSTVKMLAKVDVEGFKAGDEQYPGFNATECVRAVLNHQTAVVVWKPAAPVADTGAPEQVAEPIVAKAA